LRRGVVLCLALFAACGATPQSVCRAQCDKRSSCGQQLDVAQCARACDAATAPPGSSACANADLALQQCEVKSACADYLANQGCDAERSALTAACR